MTARPEPLARGVTGLAVTRDGQLAVGLGDATALLVLEPAEMRAFALQLLLAAADLEASAAAVTEAAIAKAKGGLPRKEGDDR